MTNDEQINQQATDFAQAEYERLIAAGWSRRDAARYSRDAERNERTRLAFAARAAAQQADDDDEDPRCPQCGSYDLGMWADDGESPDADYWECHGCSAHGTVNHGSGALLAR